MHQVATEKVRNNVSKVWVKYDLIETYDLLETYFDTEYFCLLLYYSHRKKKREGKK